MAVDSTELYKALTADLRSFNLSKTELAKPDPTVEKEIAGIYTQARGHRDKLVDFYIFYTIVFTLFVLFLIAWQAYVRVDWHDGKFEIIPQWGLNLLVTGMFAQFVGLLTIVTKRVWDFKPFFAHHNHQTKLHSNEVESGKAEKIK